MFHFNLLFFCLFGQKIHKNIYQLAELPWVKDIYPLNSVKLDEMLMVLQHITRTLINLCNKSKTHKKLTTRFKKKKRKKKETKQTKELHLLLNHLHLLPFLFMHSLFLLLQLFLSLFAQNAPPHPEANALQLHELHSVLSSSALTICFKPKWIRAYRNERDNMI